MSRKSSLKRLLSGMIAVMICATALPASAFADSKILTDAAEEYETPVITYEKQKTYSEYFNENSDKERPRAEIPFEYVSCSDGAEVEIGSFEGKNDVIIWSNEDGSLDFTVNVEKSGAYNVEVCYYPITGGNTSSEMSMLIDGVSPFDTATRISFPRTWKSAYPITPNERDNETRPPQIETPMWITTPFNDADGLFNEPLYFYFDKGEHKVTLASEKASVAIAYIKLYQYEPAPAYAAPTEDELRANTGAEPIRLQGENYIYTNSQTIFPTYDRGTYLTEDHTGNQSHPVKERYNTVGDGTWDTAGQKVTWEMDVAADGYYKIGIKGRQDVMRGLYSNRRIYIDGEVPSEPFEQVKFPYDTNWLMVSPTDSSGEDAYVYLTAGKHTITLEAIPGEIGESMRRLDDIVYTANQYYLQILMITGPNPDKYTDYYVHKEIPELLGVCVQLSERLKIEQETIETLSQQTGSEATALARLADVLDRCVEKPNKIPTYISNSSIKDNIASVSSWMREYRDQPLEIDYIELIPKYGADGKENKFTRVKENFFKAMGFGIKGFIGSFFEDYTVLSDSTSESIVVWCGLGRDQTTVVKQLTESEFTPETGVDVSINLVQGTIMEAVLAGKGPDVAMFVGGEFPVNLAIRDLLVPLDDMEGFDDVITRFQDKALVHYQYDGKTYGIPIQRTFPMMFYRKDTLSELGIENPPETWDDLIDMLPALQRKYMQPGLILPGNVNGTAVAPSTEVGHTFAMLMLQSGLNYYTPDQTATNFDTVTAVDAFDMWTRFYTTYNFDQTYDAFTRFRTGEAPIVIQNYCTFYNQLNVAAPEIKGAWDFCPVPGTRREDGTVSHAANSSGSGFIVLKDCKNVEGAWKYIDWFTSTETMVEYGQNVEGVMGPLGRFESANVEALQKLNWSKSDLSKINAQLAELDEIPIIPSSYVVTRSIMNAFRAVVNDYDNARETLRWYNKDINAEITRKRKNLGLDD
ncbi:MAG: extracellular solute-binding protein [Oscillospiraceae bacterium]|nr:extracellular solute-binding protein [Oscillospiraceae bacterium]MCI7767519.1 extracellular solute-binding protein [Oscillospiraceae bacterium]